MELGTVGISGKEKKAVCPIQFLLMECQLYWASRLETDFYEVESSNSNATLFEVKAFCV